MNRLRYVCLCLICLGTMVSAQTNPAPLLNNPLVPANALPGRAGFTLTLNGTGFVSGSVVKWNGSSLVTTFVSSSQLTAKVPASHIVSARTVSVNVVNPAPGGGASNAQLFVIRKPFPAVSFGLGSPLSVSLRANPGSVGDFNGDGKPDLVFPVWSTMGGGNGTVQVCLGNGDGTFQAPVDYPLDVAYPSSPIAADFNGDGKLDLLVIGSTTIGVASVLLGNGDGTLQSAQDSFVSSTGEPTFVAVGDFNGDGTLDIAVSLYSYQSVAQVAILIGNGAGTFQPATYYAVGTDYAGGVATGDFNGDGNLDLAVAVSEQSVSSNDQVAILLGNGDGTFQDPVDHAAPGTDYFLIAADFDGDGKLDLALTVDASISGPSISVALGNGDGTFQPFVENPIVNNAYGLTAVDVNGDGKLDLITTLFGLITVFIGRGDGTFQSDFSPTRSDYALAVGDFDSDGKVDIVALDGFHTASVNVHRQINAVLSQGYVDFGMVKVGNVATAKVTLSNFGTTSLTFNRIGFTNSFRVFKETNNCGQILLPGESCIFSFAFKPQGTKNASATVEIGYSGGPKPQEIKVAGMGLR